MRAREGRPPPKRERRPGQEATHPVNKSNPKRNNRSAPNKQARPSARLMQLSLDFLAPRRGDR
jgi:hypothetical protein